MVQPPTLARMMMETMRRVRNPPLLTAAMITVLFENPPSELLGGPGEELELGAADVMERKR